MIDKELPLKYQKVSATKIALEEPEPRENLDEPRTSKQSPLASETDLPIGSKLAIFVCSFGSFLVLWEAAARFAGNPAILSGPVSVFWTLYGLLQVHSLTGTLGQQNVYGALFETVRVVALGFGLSVVVGIPIGVIMGRWKVAEMILEPWISAMNSIPIVVLIPGLYFSIGGGPWADVFVSFVLSVFTMIISTHASVKYTSNALAEVGRTFGASETQYISKILLPASLPDIIAGMRIATGRALLGAIMAEALLGANHGLGGFMMTFQEIFNTPAMMATVVLVSLVGILFLQTPKLLERRLFRWKEGERISRRLAR